MIDKCCLIPGLAYKASYDAVSEHLLWTRYDGVSDLASYYPPEWL
ncbi:hypothetical protein AB0D04_13345 [Streptomyces sp. NPDC048483]